MLCINTAELIGAVKDVAFGLRKALIPTEGTRVVVRCDNEATRGASNWWKAISRAIRHVLRQLHMTCRKGRV